MTGEGNIVILENAATLKRVNIVGKDGDLDPRFILGNGAVSNTIITGTAYGDLIYNCGNLVTN